VKGVNLRKMNEFISELENYRKRFIRQRVNEALAIHTIRHYETGFKCFFEFLAIESNARGGLCADDVNDNFLHDFLDWVSKRRVNMKASTKKQYLIRISALLKFTTKKSNKKYNFLTALQDVKIKVPESGRKYLTPVESQRLADYLYILEGVEDIKDIQKALIAKLLLFTGLRAFELRALKISDFNPDGNGAYDFKITGKGKKEAWVYIRESLIKDELSALPFKYVCETRLGKPMSHTWLWKTTSKIFQEAGIDETGVHIFRHTFAKILVDKGVTLTTIKELLRHADIKTTQIYAKADEGAKKRAIMGVF
jgi:integrase/recombinase XerD